ncbi:hypothetical protein HYFRA_00009734 [Hymenoscyphus fraxineus]|uniref:Uncharacterized protein n=1 Tax=Hymenoscyphus fraxineus TaxID=746836 RepID=A0A9N9PSL7_9HELO|nr:hypothetical protein HYFRA_00009734 [Hymenoscyphus fraxineus]
MDISSYLGPIEARDTGDNGEASEKENHTFVNNRNQSKHGIDKQKRPISMSIQTMTDLEVNYEVVKTISEWRGTRSRRNTEEEKRQTWRRSLNSPIQQFFWTDIYPIVQDTEGEMTASPIIEENAVCEEEESVFLSKDEHGNPVFSPAIHAARQAGNEDAVRGNLGNSNNMKAMHSSESKAGIESNGVDDMAAGEHLVGRVEVLTIHDF